MYFHLKEIASETLYRVQTPPVDNLIESCHKSENNKAHIRAMAETFLLL
jgi:hypothetical protein